MLNLDIFQPFKNIQYSICAIYLTKLNLPRNMRHRQENVILVGLIPGPSELKHVFNTYLDPSQEIVEWNVTLSKIFE